MQVVLVMFRAGGDRRSFSIVRDMTVIGRREDCDLRIPVGEVSRKHCRVLKDGDSVRVEDLGSSNGTFHNGQRVQTAELMPGDSVQVGPVVFVVQVDGVPADDELQPFTQQAARNLDDSIAHDDPAAPHKAPADALEDGDLEVLPEAEMAEEGLDLLEPAEGEGLETLDTLDFAADESQAGASAVDLEIDAGAPGPHDKH